jgi:ribonucleoside-diphosphate reductase alpha chain
MYKYESSFIPSPKGERVLREGRIIDGHETPADMVSRMVETVGNQEYAFTGDYEKTVLFMEQFGSALDAGDVVMSTPVMTNAGRHTEKPLTACTVPTTDLSLESRARLRSEVINLHEQGMGTGFNLDETQDPLETLHFLNNIAIESANSGREERPVGNMAVLSVRHPNIEDFITAKVDTTQDWKFNISVNLDDDFMQQFEEDGTITLDNGEERSARELFEKICNAATVCADPGILFLDRMNNRNALPGLGTYQTTAPCAEVGLIEGETCQFGYVNIGNFVHMVDGAPSLDLSRLEETTMLMTRVLDDSLEISQQNLDGLTIQNVAALKRKIGIGLCGVADAISHMGLAYDSPEARILMQDALSFINFVSKKASVQLAEERGSFGAMNLILGNRHRSNPGHLETLYGNKSTNTVSAEDWQELSEQIRTTGNLRNISTIALPPTGRSALVIDASTGVEPHFDILQANERVLESLSTIMRARFGADLFDPQTHTPDMVRLLSAAHSISPMGHVAMAAALQEFSDESISKTINLPVNATPEDVRDTYLSGYRAGMSGVTIYIDGSYKAQPKQVK